MKISIIGYGYVGKAMSELLTNKYKIDVYDPTIENGKEDKINFITREEQETNKYDLSVICVPTPMRKNGECMLDFVEDAIHTTQSELYLIKSTIEPGTTDKLKKLTKKRIVFSPEYVGESKYYNSYFPDKIIETPFWIFGGDEKDTKQIIDYFLPILGPTKKYMQMSSLEAEIVKYMENSFFATKITYCQEMYDLCEKVGADWHKVREGWLADPRINPMHTAVFKEDRGFGGKCLPKDTNAIVRYMDENKIDSTLLTAVLEKNKKIRGDR